MLPRSVRTDPPENRDLRGVPGLPPGSEADPAEGSQPPRGAGSRAAAQPIGRRNAWGERTMAMRVSRTAADALAQPVRLSRLSRISRRGDAARVRSARGAAFPGMGAIGSSASPIAMEANAASATRFSRGEDTGPLRPDAPGCAPERSVCTFILFPGRAPSGHPSRSRRRWPAAPSRGTRSRPPRGERDSVVVPTGEGAGAAFRREGGDRQGDRSGCGGAFAHGGTAPSRSGGLSHRNARRWEESRDSFPETPVDLRHAGFRPLLPMPPRDRPRRPCPR